MRKGATRASSADGERLVDAMARAGFDPLEAHRARCDPRTLFAYLELHIEQGPHLEAQRIPIGVVEGIVGIRRSWVAFTGQPDHAGTTPMERRRDAFLGAAQPAPRLRARRTPWGAGHDAQMLAAVTDSGMLFTPSRGGRSHRPDERSDWRAIERGGNVLLGALLRLAG